MATYDFFRSRLDQMIDLRHLLAVLVTRPGWAVIEATVAPKLGVVMREVQRTQDPERAAVPAGGALANERCSPKSLSDLGTLLERAKRIRTQQRNTKNKLYAMHAPEVECISSGKARHPYEFGVKVSLVVTHQQGLVVGSRSFPGNPHEGHVLSAPLEQTTSLLQDTGHSPKQLIVDLGYRGSGRRQPGRAAHPRGASTSCLATTRRSRSNGAKPSSR